MNLVMSDITRNKLGCYMAQQASLNNIPVSALVSRFTVEPAVQQRFENASKESTEFTKRINVIGVTGSVHRQFTADRRGHSHQVSTLYLVDNNRFVIALIKHRHIDRFARLFH